MSLMVARDNCRVGHTPNALVPSEFSNGRKSYCGFSNPEPSAHNVTDCCSGPVHTFDDCFYYCEPSGHAGEFEKCANKKIKTKGVDFFCNHYAYTSDSTPTVASPVGWKSVALVMGLLFGQALLS